MENIEELKSLFKAFDMIQTLVPEDGKCLEKNGAVINVTKDGNTLKITIVPKEEDEEEAIKRFIFPGRVWVYEKKKEA